MIERKETDKWAISPDGEYFEPIEAISREQAIDEGIRQWMAARLGARDTELFEPPAPPEEEADFYIGHRSEYEAGIDDCDVLWLIECLQDQADDECCESYLEGTSEDERERLRGLLSAAFKLWEREAKAEPSFFTVNDAERIAVADHAKEYRAKAAGDGE